MNRERAKGQYGVSPYFLSKLVAELPISALFPLGFGCLLYPMAGLHAGVSRCGLNNCTRNEKRKSWILLLSY